MTTASPPQTPARNRLTTLGIIAALIALTLAAYARVRTFGYIGFDDPQYIYQNDLVPGGLTFSGIWRAFTQIYGLNWHPLTMLSYMAEVQLFGVRPQVFHVTNLLLHVANTVLLYAILRRMLRLNWPAALVAGLFALHPLHVESVAWIAERKDVLSTLFWLLTMAAYWHFVQERSRRWYLIALVVFTLGLLSKPMLVTLPAVLLLMDFWPLRRNQSLGALLVEKIPFFSLAVVCSVITFFAQRASGAVAQMSEVGVGMRISTALLAYVRYLGKMFWPAKLAVFYPYPNHLPTIALPAAVLLLLGITLIALRQAKSRPYLLFGWLWYLGTLVPVIGLVQVGEQSMADRYTYIPLIGIFISLALLAADLVARYPAARVGVVFVSIAVLLACTIRTRLQVNYWRDSEALFNRTLAIAPDNPNIRYNLAIVLTERNRPAEAIEQYREVVRLEPERVIAWNNMGLLLVGQKNFVEAISALDTALRLDPHAASANYALGVAMLESGALTDAERLANESLRLDLKHVPGHFLLGQIRVRQQREVEAIPFFAEAVRLDPTHIAARSALGLAYFNSRQFPQSAEQFNEILKLNARSTEAMLYLGLIATQRHDSQAAAMYFQKLLTLDPADPRAHFQLGLLAQQSHDSRSAIEHYEAALKSNPASPAGNNLAWILATDADPQLRDGERALQLAQNSHPKTDADRVQSLDTLAAAYAESGKFAEAIKSASSALELAKKLNQTKVAAEINLRLENYRKQQPYREPK